MNNTNKQTNASPATQGHITAGQYNELMAIARAEHLYDGTMPRSVTYRFSETLPISYGIDDRDGVAIIGWAPFSVKALTKVGIAEDVIALQRDIIERRESIRNKEDAARLLAFTAARQSESDDVSAAEKALDAAGWTGARGERRTRYIIGGRTFNNAAEYRAAAEAMLQ